MKAKPVFAIAAAGIVLTLPVLIFGLPFLSDDAGFHAAWYSHFSKQLWMGDLYPRWLIEMNGGLGSPVFFFYPPAPYFFTSVLRPFFPSDANGLHQLGVAASAALIASGLTAYLWLKNLADPKAALIAAILYMAMPYHLTADLYVRAAFAEYWTFVWMPLILYFLHRLASGHKLAFVGVAVSYALLIMTHLPTTLIFSVVLFGYAICLAPKKRKLKTLITVSEAAILGVGLAAIYLLPAMTTQQFVLLGKISTGYFSYSNWLFFAKLSLWKEDKLTMALLVADMFLIATCAFLIIRSTREPQHKKMRGFWYAVAITSVLMMTELSKPVWLVVPVLQKIQFPWRFNTVLCLSVSALLAMAISSMAKRSLSSPRIVSAAALLLILAWIPPAVWKAWKVFPQTNPNQHDIGERTEEIAQSRDPAEYRPRWNKSMAAVDWELSVDENLWDQLMTRDVESLLNRAGSSAEHQPEPIITEGAGRAAINARKPREIDLHVETLTGVSLVVPQFYYPYWSAQMAGQPDSLTLSPSEPDGLLSLRVPPGDHQIQLRLKRSGAELWGQIISMACLIIMFSQALISQMISKRGRGSLPTEHGPPLPLVSR
jgi:uncharacterized metal-binding protein